MTDDAGTSATAPALRTVLAAVALAGLVASAGCAGFLGGDGGATPTPTGTDGGDGGATPTPTETLADAELPPGVDADGVNASALVAAHDESFADRTFTTKLVFDQTKTAGNDSLEQRAVQTSKLGPDGTFLTRFDQTGRTEVVQTTWGNDSVAVSNITFGGSTQYRSRDPAVVRRNLTGRQFVLQFVRMGEYSVGDRGGETVTLTADGPAEETGLGPDRTVKSYEGTLVVGPDGRIHRMEVDLVTENSQGVRTELRVVFEVVDVGGTTVEKPDWVSEGLDAVSGGAALSSP